MGKDTNNTRLTLIAAYWCNCLSPKYEERYIWAEEKVDEAVDQLGGEARTLLVQLAQSAPDEYTNSYFAAGPLEDYINLIVEEKNADEAASILGDGHLRELLPLVWGDIEKLQPLAKIGHSLAFGTIPDIIPRVVGLKELMGFWCNMCASSNTKDYDQFYDEVLGKLLNKRSRDDMIKDLLGSAPDEQAVRYLEENVLILRK
jgi:hypothetical protein